MCFVYCKTATGAILEKEFSVEYRNRKRGSEFANLLPLILSFLFVFPCSLFIPIFVRLLFLQMLMD